MRLIWRTSIRKPFSLMTQLARLRGVKTLPQLARVLGVQPASLSFVLYWLPDEQKYEQFTIPKKGGGWRLITAPKPRLKMIQTKLADLLLDIHVELEQSRSRSQCRLAHGFKRDFSIVTNATAHRNKRFVFNADLKDFFAEQLLKVRFVFVVGPFGRKSARLHERLDTVTDSVVLDVLARNFLIFLAAIIMALEVPKEIGGAGEASRP
ncbi:hypothetical protein ASG57_24655 [Bradyrhizobium sp. Leaf396]|nr:hypothetical protein ASG57_24655 [Bradyrhizobium sp. Leaf396]